MEPWHWQLPLGVSGLLAEDVPKAGVPTRHWCCWRGHGRMSGPSATTTDHGGRPQVRLPAVLGRPHQPFCWGRNPPPHQGHHHAIPRSPVASRGCQLAASVAVAGLQTWRRKGAERAWPLARHKLKPKVDACMPTLATLACRLPLVKSSTQSTTGSGLHYQPSPPWPSRGWHGSQATSSLI